MVSSTNAKDAVTFNTSNNPIAFQLTKEESLKRISQPTPIDEAIVKIWKLQILILFGVADKLIAFHGSYPDTKMQPRNVQTHFHGFTPAIPPTF